MILIVICKVMQRKRVYDGYHWSLRRELTADEMMEIKRRKSYGENTGDILQSMGVLA